MEKQKLVFREASLKDFESLSNFIYFMAKEKNYRLISENLIRSSIKLILDEGERFGMLFICQDLQKKKVVACFHVLKRNKQQIIGSHGFVEKESRRQGIMEFMTNQFLLMYNKKYNVNKLFGMVFKNNQASQAFLLNKKWEMSSEIYYGYSFALPSFKPKKVLTEQFFMQSIKEFTFEKAKSLEEVEKNIQSLKPILKRRPQKQIQSFYCYRGEQLVGYCEFYDVLNIMVCSLMVYVEVLFAKEGQGRQICLAFMRYMYQRSELHFKTVYFVKENEEDNRIEECFLEGAMFDFITMEKNIEPVAKL